MSQPDEVGVRSSSGMVVAPEVFIYYRVESADEAITCLRVAGFQQALCGQFDGLQARLLRRHGGPVEGTLLTLMETYSLGATGVDGSRIGLGDLLDAINQAAAPIASLIHGERHVEAFEACA